MKKTLLALALFAVTGTTAFAHDKDGKKGKKEARTKEMKASCTKEMKASMASGAACCMKGGKTATVQPAAKAPATVKL